LFNVDKSLTVSVKAKKLRKIASNS